MTQIYLRSFTSEKRVITLNIQTGEISAEGFDTVEAAKQVCCHGYADRIRGNVIAVYGEFGKLWFQFDKVRYDLADRAVRFLWIRKNAFTNEFRVLQNDAPVLAVTYASVLRDPIKLLDVAFDGLDEELADFPKWLFHADQDPSWRANALTAWQMGI